MILYLTNMIFIGCYRPMKMELKTGKYHKNGAIGI